MVVAHLVKLVLLGKGDSLAPPEGLLVDEGADAAELHELMLLKLGCQAELVKVVIRSDAVSKTLDKRSNAMTPAQARHLQAL